MAPVERLYSKNPAARIYELNNPTIDNETILLNATELPILISANKQLIVVVTAILQIGTLVLSSTLLIVCHPGNPLSLPKDQNIRDVEANKPTVEQTASAVTTETIAALPATDFVALSMISIKG